MGSGRSAEFLKVTRADWMADAACRGKGITDKFYVRPGEGIWEALEYCSRCPVRKECLQYAIDNGIEDGVWGGKSVRARRDPQRRYDDVPVPTPARVITLWEQGRNYRQIGDELRITEHQAYLTIRRHKQARHG